MAHRVIVPIYQYVCVISLLSFNLPNIPDECVLLTDDTPISSVARRTANPGYLIDGSKRKGVHLKSFRDVSRPISPYFPLLLLSLFRFVHSRHYRLCVLILLTLCSSLWVLSSRVFRRCRGSPASISHLEAKRRREEESALFSRKDLDH